MKIDQLKELLEGATVLEVKESDKLESICELKVCKNDKRYSFTLYGNDLGVWVGNHKNGLDIYQDFDNFIEEAFSHLIEENYSNNVYESLDFPTELAIGYKCKKCGKIFKIALTAVKNSKYRDLLQTPGQRKAFAKVLSEDYILNKESVKERLIKKLKLKFTGYKSYINGYSMLNDYEVGLMDLDKFGKQFQSCFVMDKGDGLNFVKSEIERLSEIDRNMFLKILSEVGEKCKEKVGF